MIENLGKVELWLDSASLFQQSCTTFFVVNEERYYGRIIEFVDQILVIFGRMLDLRLRTTFNTVIQACEIRQRGLRQSQTGLSIVSCDHGEGRVVRSRGEVVQSRVSSCEVLS
jgi:hypothetical protein